MKSEHKPVNYVTRPALPSLQELNRYLEEIWDNRILTNNGPFHRQFESALAEFLGVKYVSLFANGTLALMTALKALRISGEVITTPYSFVATSHSLLWNNIKPVFADVDSKYCNIDPEKIEAAITPGTTAILPVHVYGNPCQVEVIQEIAGRHGLKVIYDACHTFGVRMNGMPVLNFGDLSVLSFHATKVFTTFEGGAVICHDRQMKQYIDYLKNFGFAGETSVLEVGINAKMNEFQAALGLLQLEHIGEYISRRRRITEFYRNYLRQIPGLRYMDDMPGVEHCYSYFPVFIEETGFGMSRDELYKKLKKNDIFARRYFYPLISQFPQYQNLDSARPDNLPEAENLTRQVLCLPLYPDLTDEELIKIVQLIRG